jgi:hypothetical protein
MDEFETFLGGGPTAIEPQAEEGQPRGDDGRFLPKETGVEPAEPQGEAQPVPPTDKLPQEDYKAIREEREKRQALEREVEALRNQMAQQPPEPTPSVWEDEDGKFAHERAQAVNQSTLHARVMMSEMLATREYPDFAEMKAAYLDMERENPALIPQVMNSPDPWGTAYKIAKNAQTMRELGAVDMATLEAKMREKIEAELKAQPTAALPASLADAQSSRIAASAPPGPASLEDILRGKV